MHRALTIAGSDSGGGAGIQADLKTFAAHGVYGTSAITAITAQNTLGVRAWEAVSPELVRAQIDAVVSDIGTDAVKIGMLATAATVAAVARAITELDLANVVLDPVMIAKAGDRLLEDAAIHALRTTLLPIVDVLTPNIPEAQELTGRRIRSVSDMHDVAVRIRALGPGVVVVKGGHAEGDDVIDVVATSSGVSELRGPRIAGRHTHGTGCTLSSAIAALLARGLSIPDALTEARRYLQGAIEHAPQLGSGHGPLNHFWRLY